ncbi:hypothetical protein [Candidatus Formimonas warabiya]|uniref:Uncharacterized protein n=1 Tax=Formimonas warabiya TaxID=1761012 RepID=A0A3G1KRY2_FORW1|nr:hypothetical protein [Candidatus Formimonas warabiya]ATW25144.1 hypothetical protein DCMF_10520 [Candidatus Formimonas warabiya]
MDPTELNKLILDLLERDCYKATDHLVEELRVEYPQQYRQVMEAFCKEYDLSGCGAEMSPITVLNVSLNALLKEQKIEKKRENGISMWRLL